MATAADIDTRKYPLSTVIGVFLDGEQANKAIDELRQANFSYERIRVVKRGNGGLADTLHSLFTGGATMPSHTSNDLVQMGMPEYEANYYQYELDSEHVLLIMNADDRPESAFSIMRQNGAFDINSRLKINSTEAWIKGDQSAEQATPAAEPQNTDEEAPEGAAPVPADAAPAPVPADAVPDEQYPDVAPNKRYPDEERATREPEPVASDSRGAED